MIGEQASCSRCLVPHTRPPLPPSRWPERRVLLPPLYSGGGGQGGPARTLRRLCGSGGPGREPVWRGPKPGFPSPQSPPRGSRPTARTHPGPVALLRGSGGPTLLSDTAVTAPWHGPCWTRGDTGRNGKGAPRVGWGQLKAEESWLSIHLWAAKRGRRRTRAPRGGRAQGQEGASAGSTRRRGRPSSGAHGDLTLMPSLPQVCPF